MEDRQEIMIRPEAWSDDASMLLAKAMVHDPLCSVATLRDMVDTQQAVLFEVSSAGALAAYYVVRIDRRELGDEGVVVAAAGALRGVRLLDAVLPIIESQFIDCATVRIHSARPGMARALQRHGYRPAEVVYRKVIHVPAAH